MAELPDEPVLSALDRTTGDHTTADPRTEGDHHEVVDTSSGAQTPFGHGGTGRIIVDEHGALDTRRNLFGQGIAVECRDVRRTVYPAGRIHESGRADTDRHRVIATALPTAITSMMSWMIPLARFESLHQIDHGIDDQFGRRRGGMAVRPDHDPAIIDGQTETFGPTDIDTDPHGAATNCARPAALSRLQLAP